VAAPDAPWRASLAPLAAAAAALAALTTRLADAPEALAAGCRARLAYREAAGWLALQGTWVHPVDLALRDAHLAGSYAAATLGQRLPSVLPATLAGEAAEAAPSAPPADVTVAQALALARVWRRLGERAGWGDAREEKGRRELLAALGEADHAAASGWQAAVAACADLPPLLAAAAAVPAWPAPAPLAAASVLLGAALWRSASGTRGLALPLFAAPLPLLQRLAVAPAASWPPAFLAAVAAAAEAGMQEFLRLRTAAARAAALPHTARARLPAAAALALRQPVLTRPMLARALGISPQAALGLLDRLAAGGVLREATGRAAWRVFVVA
jgi:hypothetical protein